MHVLTQTLIEAIKAKNTFLITHAITEIAKQANAIDLINFGDKDGMTPLHHACVFYNKAEIKIDENGIEKNEKAESSSILCQLAEHGADFDVVNNEGKTPETLIAQFSDEEKAEFKEAIKKTNAIRHDQPLDLPDDRNEEKKSSDEPDIEAPPLSYQLMSQDRSELHKLMMETNALIFKTGTSPVQTILLLLFLWGWYSAALGVRAYHHPVSTNDNDLISFIAFAAFLFLPSTALSVYAIRSARSSMTQQEIAALTQHMTDMLWGIKNVDGTEDQQVVKSLQKFQKDATSLGQALQQNSKPDTTLRQTAKDIKELQTNLNLTGKPLAFFKQRNAAAVQARGNRDDEKQFSDCNDTIIRGF